MVGNLSTTTQGQVVTGNGEIKYGQKLEDLEKSVDGHFLFSASQYPVLREYTQFSEICLFCHKPSHGRTVDVAITVDDQIFNYLLDDKSSFNYCDKIYRYLPADNSLLSTVPCKNLDGVRFGYGITGAIFHKPDYYHILFVQNFPHSRFECDDFENTVGELGYFVR